MLAERYPGQPLPLVFSFDSNPFTVYNKDYSDIVNLFVNLKIDVANDADDLYMQQDSDSGNVTWDENTHTFTVTIDYTNLVVGQTYQIIMAANLGFSELVEFCMEEGNSLSIKADKNRA